MHNEYNKLIIDLFFSIFEILKKPPKISVLRGFVYVYDMFVLMRLLPDTKFSKYRPKDILINIYFTCDMSQIS